MERLLGRLSVGSTDLSAVLGASDGTTKGLDKILAIAGLKPHHTNVLYGCYLDHRLALIKLKGHLLLEFKPSITGQCQRYALQLVNGAVTALKNNAYKSVDCYKCGGDGLVNELTCARCSGIGKTSQKPKEYQLCNVSRSLWYKKESLAMRDLYVSMVSHLLQLDHELKQTITNYGRDS